MPLVPSSSSSAVGRSTALAVLGVILLYAVPPMATRLCELLAGWRAIQPLLARMRDGPEPLVAVWGGWDLRAVIVTAGLSVHLICAVLWALLECLHRLTAALFGHSLDGSPAISAESIDRADTPSVPSSAEISSSRSSRAVSPPSPSPALSASAFALSPTSMNRSVADSRLLWIRESQYACRLASYWAEFLGHLSMKWYCILGSWWVPRYLIYQLPLAAIWWWTGGRCPMATLEQRLHPEPGHRSKLVRVGWQVRGLFHLVGLASLVRHFIWPALLRSRIVSGS